LSSIIGAEGFKQRNSFIKGFRNFNSLTIQQELFRIMGRYLILFIPSSFYRRHRLQ